MNHAQLIVRGTALLVDAEELERVSSIKWRIHPQGYALGKANGQNTSLHRFVFGPTKASDIDHVNGNRLDNRKANLRACSHAQNIQNRGVDKRNRFGLKGVSLTCTGKYGAEIRAFGKHVWLGSFDSPIDAAMAWDRAALEMHGPFARTNQSLGLIPAGHQQQPPAVNNSHQEFMAVLALREAGKSYDEIAEALSIPSGTVKSRLHRARRIGQKNQPGATL